MFVLYWPGVIPTYFIGISPMDTPVVRAISRIASTLRSIRISRYNHHMGNHILLCANVRRADCIQEVQLQGRHLGQGVGQIFFNTIFLNLLFIATGTLFSIGLALVFVEIKNKVYNKVVQTIAIFPHSVSFPERLPCPPMSLL